MKEKQKYNIFQNIRYAFANIWKVDKLYYLAFVPQIPISVFLPLAGVYFPKILIDLIERRAGDADMLMTIGGYCMILVAAGLISFFCDMKIMSTSYTFSIHYQYQITDKSTRMDYENLENPKISDMLNHTYAGGMAAENIAKELNGLLITLLGIFTYGSIIGMLNPLILILLIVSSVINYLMLRYVRNYTEKNKDKWTPIDRKNGYLWGLSSDYSFAKDIKLYNMQSWLLEMTEHFRNLRMQWHNKVFNRRMLSEFVDGGLRFVRDGVAYAVLITMLLNNKIDVGSFVFYFGAIAGFSNWLSTVINRFNTIVNQNVDINRMRAYFDIEDRFNHGEGTMLPTENEIPYEIEFKDLTYNYIGSEKSAVDGVNLKINKGEKIAVVGVNGAGKTTLVKLMCGLYYPTSGAVLLNGKDVKDYNIDEYYTQFSAVFQDIGLLAIPISHFVAARIDNIDTDRVWQSLQLAGLDSVVKKLPNGLDTHLIKGVFEDGIDLSGGEKQKLMLARALYKNAPVIVLDEPTAALDPIAENELYMKYADLTAGKTSVYISHRLSSTRFCDRIVFIQDGKIAECGSHDELMKNNGLYANMFNIQSHYYKEDAVNEEN